MAERDRRDRERAVAPLKPADDAVVVDTTGLNVDTVVARVLEIARSRMLATSSGE
jgi:cytidylate kinase